MTYLFHVQKTRPARSLPHHSRSHVHECVRRAEEREKDKDPKAIAVLASCWNLIIVHGWIVVLGVPVHGIPAFVHVIFLRDPCFDGEVGREVSEDPNHDVHRIVRAARLCPRPGKEKVPEAS